MQVTYLVQRGVTQRQAMSKVRWEPSVSGGGCYFSDGNEDWHTVGIASSDSKRDGPCQLPRDRFGDLGFPRYATPGTLNLDLDSGKLCHEK